MSSTKFNLMRINQLVIGRSGTTQTSHAREKRQQAAIRLPLIRSRCLKYPNYNHSDVNNCLSYLKRPDV